MRDPFDREGPRLSLVDLPSGQDALAEFAAEPAAAPQTAPKSQLSGRFELIDPLDPLDPLEPPEPFEPLEPIEPYRIPRAFFALAALAAVAVISVATLNWLTGRVALDTPQPAGVVASAAPPAPPPAQRAVVSRPPEPQPVQGAIEPARQAPPAPVKPLSVTRAAQTPPSSAQRVNEPARPIASPTRERPPVQPAAPPRIVTRPVDNAPASASPAATATTGVQPTNTVSSVRVDPLPVPAPSAAPAAPAAAAVTSPPPASPPTSSAPPPAAAAPAAVSTARVVPATALIEVVLERYESAFSALDASSAKAVWPAVNERNLARAFESLEQQEFDLGNCEIKVTEPRAVASCRGTARYTPRMGSRRMRTESRQWTFTLESKGETWSIASVDSR